MHLESVLTGYSRVSNRFPATAGRVFFSARRRDLEDELASFPLGTHDDQVGSVTMALNCLRESTYASEPPPILTSESQFTAAGLRRYLDREHYVPFGPDWRW
jgi:hypothetical protein